VATILIVDDDVQLTAMLAVILTAEGHKVRIAHDGKRGIKMVTKALPDVILLDLALPGVDGSGFVYRLHFMGEGYALIPIVLLSGHADLAEAADRLGTHYYVRKPPILERLMPVLSRALLARIPPTPLRPFELGTGGSTTT
jgi:CheY-like chemotaxis protein